MNLKEFISQSLSEIVCGTKEAAEKLKDDVSICANTNGDYSGYPSVSYVSSLKTRRTPLTVVSFKLQVQVMEEASVDGSTKANVLNVIGSSASGGSSTGSSLLQEVSFSIPLSWKEKDR